MATNYQRYLISMIGILRTFRVVCEKIKKTLEKDKIIDTIISFYSYHGYFKVIETSSKTEDNTFCIIFI